MPNDDQWIDIPSKDEWIDIPDQAVPAKEFQQLTPWQAAGQGGMGFLQGAIGDLLPNIGIGLKQLGALALDPVGFAQRNIPQIPGAISQAIETTKMAGAEPEAFGRMMGNIAGQPLATEGLGPATRALGYPVAGYGRIMQRYSPASWFMPRDIFGMRIRAMFLPYLAARAVERGVGRNIVEPMGEFMKSPTLPESISRAIPPVSSSGSRFTPNIPVRYGVVVPEEGPKQLPAGREIAVRNTSQPKNPPPKPAARDSISSKDLSRPKRLEAGSATPPTNVFPRFRNRK